MPVASHFLSFKVMPRPPKHLFLLRVFFPSSFSNPSRAKIEILTVANDKFLSRGPKKGGTLQHAARHCNITNHAMEFHQIFLGPLLNCFLWLEMIGV